MLPFFLFFLFFSFSLFPFFYHFIHLFISSCGVAVVVIALAGRGWVSGSAFGSCARFIGIGCDAMNVTSWIECVEYLRVL